MGLIKRSQKGSKLTVQELDGNLTYLESIGVSGLTQPINNVIEINRPNGEKVSGVINSYNLDIEEIINDDVVYYKNTQYEEFNIPQTEIILRDDNNEPIEIINGKSYSLDIDLMSHFNNPKSFFNSTVVVIQIQSDGKILVGGLFTTYNGTTRNRIIRLNSDGSIDNAFNIGTGFDSSVQVIQLQSDGKILVGGQFTSYNGTTSNRIIRLNSDGSIDNAFNIGSGFNGIANSIQIQSDGKILLSGQFTTYNGTTSNRIIRLNSDGSIDNTFNIGTGFNNDARIRRQSDGKILVSGSFTTYNGITSNRIIRLNSDGSIDTSFNIGTGFDGQTFSNNIQSDGKILIGGFFNTYNGTSRSNFIRLNSDGSIDNTFNIGTGFNSSISIIEQQLDGKILVGGGFTTYNGTSINRFIRLDSDGSRDNTFSIGTGFNSNPSTIQIQSDGKILVGGGFTTYNGTSINNFIGLNSNGSIDTGFVADTSITLPSVVTSSFLINSNPFFTPNATFSIGTGFNNTVFFITTQSDGKILVGGSFTTYNGTTSNRIIRLNSDGSIDNTFNIGTGFNSTVETIQIQPDGKILVGGSFTSYNGTTINRFIRLNSDGSRDDTFSIGTGFGGNGVVRTIAIQSDGKILFGGDFTSYNGTNINRIIRLNSDGSIDNTFSVGNGFDGRPWVIQIQSDGKILVGGGFTFYNGPSSNRIIRLNTDGSRDDTFSIGTGFSSDVETIQIQLDGKILVGGNFTSYNGTTNNRIIRLNSDGSIDALFNIGTGFDSIVYSIVIQSDGKILVGGQFGTYNGITSIIINRLNPNGSSFLTDGIGFFLFKNTPFFNTGVFNSDLNNNIIKIDTNLFIKKYVINYNLVELKSIN